MLTSIWMFMHTAIYTYFLIDTTEYSIVPAVYISSSSKSNFCSWYYTQSTQKQEIQHCWDSNHKAQNSNQISSYLYSNLAKAVTF